MIQSYLQDGISWYETFFDFDNHLTPILASSTSLESPFIINQYKYKYK